MHRHPGFAGTKIPCRTLDWRGTFVARLSTLTGQRASDRTHADGRRSVDAHFTNSGHASLRFRDQRAQIIPERLKRRIDLNVLGSQDNKRVKFQPKTGLADRPRHAVNDVVGP